MRPANILLRLHLDRIARGDRHHRCLDRSAAAGGAEGARGGQCGPVQQQRKAVDAGDPRLRGRHAGSAAVKLQSGSQRADRQRRPGQRLLRLLPYYEQGNLFNQYTQDIPNPGYLTAEWVPLTIHVCPSDPTTNNGIGSVAPNYATGNYALNLALWGANGTLTSRRLPLLTRSATIPDGSSNTIGIVEASGCFPGYPAVDPQTGP